MTSTISNNPVVLIADDLPWVIQSWESTLTEYGVEVIKATTIRALLRAFLDHEDAIDAIILDGCIPGSDVNTIAFIRQVRLLGFTKPIIAASSLEEYRQTMMYAGCDAEAPKESAAELAVDLLTA